MTIFATTKVQKMTRFSTKTVTLHKYNSREMQIIRAILTLCLGCSIFFSAKADPIPAVHPKMVIELPTGDTEETSYTGSAPIVAHFTANPENVGNYAASYEWHIYESGKQNAPYVIRYDADIDYTFRNSVTSQITLTATFILGTDTLVYDMEEPFSVTPTDAILQVPNTFTPNGDGTNDIFKVKDGYQSIVKFHGYIFNRWGKKMFDWTDISQGWDGTYGGKDAPDGVYFCHIEAQGANGRKFHVKKAINLLRKYREKL